MSFKIRNENEIASILLEVRNSNSEDNDIQSSSSSSSSSKSDDLSIQSDYIESEEDAEIINNSDINFIHSNSNQSDVRKDSYNAENDAESEKISEIDAETDLGISSVSKKRRKDESNLLEGENNCKWNIEKPKKRGKRSTTKITNLAKPLGLAREIKTPLESWSLLFSDEILEEVVKHTNERIASKNERGKTKPEEKFRGNVSLVELKAFIGLSYAFGILKMNDTNLEDLWSVSFGVKLFQSTMSLNRFNFLNGNIRFGDKNTRIDAKNIDKFSPIRNIWDIFIENCGKHYSAHQYVTIDQQLLSFQGKCGFRVCMKTKSDKYGLKIYAMNDARTFYMINAIPYVGKSQTESSEELQSRFVRDISEPIRGTNRTITCNNSFTSVELVDQMMKEYSPSMVGTIRKSRKGIPESFKTSESVGSSRFIYNKNKTLVNFIPKKGKIVLALSSLHAVGKVDEITGKPEIILHYNSTKGSSDTFNHFCKQSTTLRRTHRWSMRVWYGMLDQCGINSMILYLFNANNEVLSRREFLKQLSLALVEPFSEEREATARNLRRNPKLFDRGEMMSLKLVPERTENNVLNKKVRCSMCPREQDRKTRIYCTSCKYPMCNLHRLSVCVRCMNDGV